MVQCCKILLMFLAHPMGPSREKGLRAEIEEQTAGLFEGHFNFEIRVHDG